MKNSSLSVKSARKLLGSDDSSFTDEEIIKMIHLFEVLAEHYLEFNYPKVKSNNQIKLNVK